MLGASIFWGIVFGGLAAWQAGRKGNNALSWFMIVGGLIVVPSFIGLTLMGQSSDVLGAGIVSLGALAAFVALLVVSFSAYHCKTCGAVISKQEYSGGDCPHCRPAPGEGVS